MKDPTPLSGHKTTAEWRAILADAAPRGKPWILDGFADALPGLAERFKIDTEGRQAHFIAQCAHESDGFKTTVEYADGSAYEGRRDLGNSHKGDGKRFRGRGLIQLTGRHNYTAAAAALGQPYVDDPERVARFPHAADVSGWFWHTHNCNSLADKDDVRLVTQRVNGGLNGLDSRMAYLDACKGALIA